MHMKIFGLVLLLLLTSAYATTLSSCGVLSVAGTYTLNQSITANQSPCLSVQTSGIIIDGNGSSITSNGFILAVNDTGQGYVVQNLTLSNYTQGFNFTGPSNFTNDVFTNSTPSNSLSILGAYDNALINVTNFQVLNTEALGSNLVSSFYSQSNNLTPDGRSSFTNVYFNNVTSQTTNGQFNSMGFFALSISDLGATSNKVNLSNMIFRNITMINSGVNCSSTVGNDCFSGFISLIVSQPGILTSSSNYTINNLTIDLIMTNFSSICRQTLLTRQDCGVGLITGFSGANVVSHLRTSINISSNTITGSLNNLTADSNKSSSSVAARSMATSGLISFMAFDSTFDMINITNNNILLNSFSINSIINPTSGINSSGLFAINAFASNTNPVISGNIVKYPVLTNPPLYSRGKVSDSGTDSISNLNATLIYPNFNSTVFINNTASSSINFFAFAIFPADPTGQKNETSYANFSFSSPYNLSLYYTAPLGVTESTSNLWNGTSGTWISISNAGILDTSRHLFTTNNTVNGFASSVAMFANTSSHTLVFSNPTPANLSNDLNSTVIINETADSILTSTGTYLQIDGTNYSCILSGDSKSCSYTIPYNQLLYNHTYSNLGHGNISGLIYDTDELRVFNYNGCGNIASSGPYTLQNGVSSSSTCFTVNASNVAFNCQNNQINMSGTSSTDYVFDVQNLSNFSLLNCQVNSSNTGTPTGFNFYKVNGLTLQNNSLGNFGGNGLRLNSTNITLVSNNTYFGNTKGMFISTSDPSLINFTNNLLDLDGSLSDYRNITLNDTLLTNEIYSINYSASPGSAPLNFVSFGKYVNFTKTTSNMNVSNLTWYWLTSELGGFNDSEFSLWFYNNGWNLTTFHLDANTNQISTFGVNTSGIYAIMENATVPTLFLTGPTPLNDSDALTPLIFNETTGGILNATNNFIQVNLVNYTCSRALDNRSCSLALNYSQLIFNSTYSLTGFGNISNTEVQTTETNRTFTYNGCGNIVNSGSYSLNSQIDGYGGTCLSVNASNVRLDCQNNMINQNLPNSGSANGINGTSISNLSVLSCQVNGFDIGIGLTAVSDSFFNNTIINNTGSNGIALLSGNGNNFTFNQIYASGASGIFVDSPIAANTLISNNFVTGSGTYGILLSTNSNAVIMSNDLEGNSIGLSATGTDLLISGNVIKSSLSNGVELPGLTSGNLSDNRIKNNVGIGLYLQDTQGLLSLGNHFFNNSIDWEVDPQAVQVIFNSTADIFDSPLGTLTNYSNVSINDSSAVGDSYLMTWASQPGALPGSNISFAGKFFNITTLTGSPVLDQLTFNWLPTEIGGLNQSTFGLYKHNSSWFSVPATLNATLHTLNTTDLSPSAIYGILSALAPALVYNSTLNYTNETAYTNFTVGSNQITTHDSGNFEALYTSTASTVDPLGLLILGITGLLLAVYAFYTAAKFAMKIGK